MTDGYCTLDATWTSREVDGDLCLLNPQPEPPGRPLLPILLPVVPPGLTPTLPPLLPPSPCIPR